MYPLLPWKLLSGAVGATVFIAVYLGDITAWLGYPVADRQVVRYLPMLLLGGLAAVFGPTGYWAPWRFVWRLCPLFNRWLPDLNGIWVGTTGSNWPTIERMMDAAQSTSMVTEAELLETAEQHDAMAVRVTCSLFRLSVEAGLSSTGGTSHSITAKPWRHQHSNKVHVSYVYEQQTPNPVATDLEAHLGAANLAFETEQPSVAEGIYWTRRNWRTGRNTAGTLQLKRSSERLEQNKSLQQVALEHRETLLESSTTLR